jgi:hypothetical protein
MPSDNERISDALPAASAGPATVSPRFRRTIFRQGLLILVSWLLGPALAPAGDILYPWMNFHPPFQIQSFYWYRCPYGLAGPTDKPCQPVNGIGPPPLIIPPCCGCHPITGEPIVLYSWNPYVRSPRDYFMMPPIR